MSDIAQRILDYINLYDARSSVQVAVIKKMCLDQLLGPLPTSSHFWDRDDADQA